MFKIKLDKHWQHQDTIYDNLRAQIDGNESRSEVSRVNVV